LRTGTILLRSKDSKVLKEIQNRSATI